MTNFLKSLKENTVKSYKTTMLGLILIIAGIASVFYEKASWMESTSIILVGLGLIISPDTIKKKIKDDKSC
jgi:protein-S-isoprenylcysteine O-methyltransferase Ste14